MYNLDDMHTGSMIQFYSAFVVVMGNPTHYSFILLNL